VKWRARVFTCILVEHDVMGCNMICQHTIRVSIVQVHGSDRRKFKNINHKQIIKSSDLKQCLSTTDESRKSTKRRGSPRLWSVTNSRFPFKAKRSISIHANTTHFPYLQNKPRVAPTCPSINLKNEHLLYFRNRFATTANKPSGIFEIPFHSISKLRRSITRLKPKRQADP